MSFIQVSGLRYLKFDIFPQAVTQAVFTRQGGVSPSPWDTLNVGGTVGDEATRVKENKVRSLESVGCRPDSIFDVWQVHSADFVFAKAPRAVEEAYQKADIILTDSPRVTLYMRFADCVPVFLYDPVKSVVGMVHAGWLGTVRGAAREAVRAMIAGYGSNPADLLAAIGPSIGVDHYEIKADVVGQVTQAFGADATGLIAARDGKTFLDLWGANRLQLEQAGVPQVEVAGLCTACQTEDWFSHRAESGRTGRFGALIALPA